MLCNRIGINIAAFHIYWNSLTIILCFSLCVLVTWTLNISFVLFRFYFCLFFIQFQNIMVHCAASFIQMGIIIHIYAKIPELTLIHTLYIIAASSIQRWIRIYEEIHRWNIPQRGNFNNYCSDFCNSCLNDFSFFLQSTQHSV